MTDIRLMRVRANNASKNHPATVASGPQVNAQGAVRTAPATVTAETLEKLLWWFVG